MSTQLRSVILQKVAEDRTMKAAAVRSQARYAALVKAAQRRDITESAFGQNQEVGQAGNASGGTSSLPARGGIPATALGRSSPNQVRVPRDGSAGFEMHNGTGMITGVGPLGAGSTNAQEYADHWQRMRRPSDTDRMALRAMTPEQRLQYDSHTNAYNQATRQIRQTLRGGYPVTPQMTQQAMQQYNKLMQQYAEKTPAM